MDEDAAWYGSRPPPLPLVTASGLGECCSSPSGSWRSPAAKRISVRFTAQNLQICEGFTHVQKRSMQQFNEFFSKLRVKCFGGGQAEVWGGQLLSAPT